MAKKHPQRSVRPRMQVKLGAYTTAGERLFEELSERKPRTAARGESLSRFGHPISSRFRIGQWISGSPSTYPAHQAASLLVNTKNSEMIGQRHQ